MMRIIPLSEGTFTIDQTKRFIPFDASRHELSNRPSGSLLVEIQPFVVITENDVILLDTGLGFHNADGNLQIHQNLLDNDINPMDITKVLMSHLHKDHAGGAGLENKILNHFNVSFPNASYYVQKKELEFAFEKGAPSFVPTELEVFRNMEKLVLVDGDGSIDNNIRYALSSGHSPFHQVFWIEEGGETIFFGGDEAPQLHQMKSRFIAKYDHDGKKAMELRQKWWEEGKGWTFLFYHDIKTPYLKHS
ncbi:MAG TPA: MBL fold metallo-hydrolase [Chitinophagaceae bacterium]|nr:MBL fold metallo-hydrolase [Chitinophagaceae bacterium]